MDKKISNIIKVLFVIVIVSILIIYVFFNFNKFDYQSSLTYARNFLNNNYESLNKLANEYLENHDLKTKKYKIVKSIRYSKTEYIYMKELENVIFECNYQGSLGGQSWGLLFIPNNKYLDSKKLFIYNEKELNTGNNIFIRRKLKDNWFFYYDDWDGKVDLSKVK